MFLIGSLLQSSTYAVMQANIPFLDPVHQRPLAASVDAAKNLFFDRKETYQKREGPSEQLLELQERE